MSRRASAKSSDCLAIAAVYAAIAALLGPFQDAPFIDDWVYAWPVEHLLASGELGILDYSTSINLGQIGWGALFCLPLGFSFSALRFSTWVLSVACLCGLYLTQRELGVPRRNAWLGTAVLAFYPVFFVLSFSFMTDVPFLALMIWFSFALIRAVRNESDPWLAAAALFGSVAITIRLLGVAAPAVMLPVLWFHAGAWGRRRGRFLMAAIPLAVALLVAYWYPSHVEHRADLSWINSSPMNRVAALKSGFRYLPIMFVAGLTFASGALGVALLPLTAGLLTRAQARAALLLALLLGGALWIQTSQNEGYSSPLTVGSTWSPHELGATEPLTPNYQAPEMPSWWGGALTTITVCLAALCLAGLLPQGSVLGESVLYWHCLVHLLLVAVLWLFYDRYALVFVPAAIVLLLRGNRIRRPLVSLGLVGLLAVVSVVGMRDHLSYNRALWSGVQDLQAKGVAAADINAGYVVNGWLQYAHPESSVHDEDGSVIVPWINSRDTRAYEVSNRVSDNWTVIRRIPYTRWLGRSGHLYIQKNPAPSAEP